MSFARLGSPARKASRRWPKHRQRRLRILQARTRPRRSLAEVERRGFLDPLRPPLAPISPEVPR